nr:recombinase family protein [uncultured Acetatifactor sp.]
MRIEKLDSQMAVPERRRKRVAAYVRVSTEKEMALNSLENQAEIYTAQIKANPEWAFSGIYEDRGISGTKEMRPAFQQLLTDCREGKIDLILTKSFTRFARNTVVLLSTLRELKSLGVDVYFEKDNIHSLSETGEFLITLLAAYAQAESYSASENVKWRIRKAFEEGKLTGGRRIGYRMENGSLIIVPEEAEIVRLIYDSYLSGMSEIAIARKLSRMGMTPICGQKIWSRSTIHDILRNEKYAGNLLLQKTYVENYISKKQKKNRGERTQYLVENSHEAIIPKEMFETVQEEIKKRAEANRHEHPQQNTKKYPFSGMIKCGQCGRYYRRRYLHPRSAKKKAVWVCRTFDAYGKEFCHSQQIPEDILTAETIKVLGSDDLETAVPDMLSVIYVPEVNHLVYVFRDGSEQDVFWEHRSRKESWTEEMRQKARELALERNRIRREGNNNA